MSGDDGEGAKVYDFGAAKRQRDYEFDEWVKKEDIAAHFHVSTSTIYRWVKQGCPTKRLRGGTLRFQVRPLADWLDQLDE